jgi:hypothetical protein
MLSGRICLPVSAGVCLLIAGWTVTGPLRNFGAWLVLAILGQAVSLQLIDAGNLLRYQHYKIQILPLGTGTVLLGFLIIQATVVTVGLSKRRTQIRQLVTSYLRGWQLLVLALVFILSSAPVSSNPRAYVFEIIVASLIQALNLANICLVVLALPQKLTAAITKRMAKLFDTSTEAAKPRFDRIVIIGALWVATLAAFLSIYTYQGFPHIPDEVVYYWQARHFAAGQMTLPVPPVVEGFDIYLMDTNAGRWFTSTQPGWPLVLAVGMFFGTPWLINPLLAGLNVLLIYALLNALYDRGTARLSVVLVCLSPWYIFMAMNFMTHIITLTCALIGALGIVRSRSGGRWVWPFISGAAISAAAMIRPLDGFIVGLVLGIWSLGFGGKRLRLPALAALMLGGLLLGAPIFIYNRALTGSFLQFPVNAYFDNHFGRNTNALGFGPERGMGWPLDPFPGHSPLDALINANLNTASINTELFGWSIGSLVFVALVFLSRRKQSNDRAMITVMTAVFVAHIFYYFSGGPDFGARYWFLMFVPCVVLTVRAMQVITTMRREVSTGYVALDGRIALAVLLLCGMTLLNFFPWRAIDKYHHYQRMTPQIADLEKQNMFGRSLVLIRGNQHPDYASAWLNNPIDLETSAPIYAWDRNLEIRNRLLNYYQDRPVWVLDGPTLTGSGFRVAAGPLSTVEARALPNLTR